MACDRCCDRCKELLLAVETCARRAAVLSNRQLGDREAYIAFIESKQRLHAAADELQMHWGREHVATRGT